MPIPRRCLTCGSVFQTLIALREHCSLHSHSFNPYICNPCNRAFGSIRALQMHLNSRRHANDPVVGLSVGSSTGGQNDSLPQTAPGLDTINQDGSDMHNICSACHRTFTTSWGLERHKASLAHSPRILGCPFCKSKFKSASGMTMHLEDSCKSKITRHQVTTAVQSMGFTPDISIDRRIEGIHESSESLQRITTTSNSNPPTTTSQFFATEDSFNGCHYVCPLADQCNNKTFNNLDSLNQHLNSPAHDENQFKCPGCFTEFKLISGFIQHVEGRTCVDSGSATFEQIEVQIGSFASFFSHNLVVDAVS